MTSSLNEKTFQGDPPGKSTYQTKIEIRCCLHPCRRIHSLQNKAHLFEIDCIIENQHIVLMKRWVFAEVRRVLPQPGTPY